MTYRKLIKLLERNKDRLDEPVTFMHDGEYIDIHNVMINHDRDILDEGEMVLVQ